MERIEDLITQARADTDNEEFSDTTGIPDSSFLSWANRAQTRIQAAILNVYPKAFQAEVEVQAVAGQEAYDLPAYLFLGTRIERVEFTPSGNDRDYYEIHLANDHMRRGLEANRPYWYIRQSSRLIMMPAPSSAVGKFRITFQKQLPKLDVQRATVAAATVGATQLTALTLELDDFLTDENVAALQNDYISIVDEDGTILMAGIRIGAIDTSTGVVTLPSAHTFESGETAPTGAFVVAGKRATHVSQLPDACEDFLSAFMEWRALRKDSSDDAADTKEEMETIEARIVESYAGDEPNILGVPILDDQYLAPEG